MLILRQGDQGKDDYVDLPKHYSHALSNLFFSVGAVCGFGNQILHTIPCTHTT